MENAKAFQIRKMQSKAENKKRKKAIENNVGYQEIKQQPKRAVKKIEGFQDEEKRQTAGQRNGKSMKCNKIKT